MRMRISMWRGMGGPSTFHSQSIHADRPEDRSRPAVAPPVWIWDFRGRRGFFTDVCRPRWDGLCRPVQALAMRGGLRQLGHMEDLIIIDPAVCNGRPVVKGTRITVQTIMEFLAAGDSVDEVLEAYPTLTRGQVLACMEWASRLMGNHFQIAELA